MLVPTRYMTSVPFDWSSVLNDGVLLEANSGFGSGRLGYPGLSEHIGDDETPDSVGYVPLL